MPGQLVAPNPYLQYLFKGGGVCQQIKMFVRDGTL